MARYLYDTHVHTSEASACARVSGAGQARIYKELGYTGIIITDHFFNGNTCIPSYYSWEKRIELFCKGYENAKKEGDRIGLQVFFGWEAGFDATDFLVYGLEKEWLLEHPDMLSWSVEEQYNKVKEAGGMVVHAHPFRRDSYIPMIRLFPDYIDAVEGINLANEVRGQGYDQQAIEYAKEHKFPITEGSDAHNLYDKRGGMLFDTTLHSIKDYISIVKSQTGYGLKHYR